jgi:hypothetical protein
VSIARAVEAWREAGPSHRGEQLRHMMGSDRVRRFYEGYAGGASVDAIAAAAGAADLPFDDEELGLVVVCIQHDRALRAMESWRGAPPSLRGECLKALLSRHDVLTLFEAGPSEPDEMWRTFEAAGVRVDELDVGLLALAARESTGSRWVEGS